jgi:RNA polymerase sigma-70 factor (ECF subfamily)
MPHVEETSDEALLARVKAGDEAALGTLCERYHRPLYGYLHRMLGDAAEAEDVFQETFLRVVKHLPRFEEGRRVKPWVYTIASNLVKNVYRSRHYREKTSIDQESATGEPLSRSLAALGNAPIDAAADRERAVAVREAIDRLTPTSRDALVLFYFQGLAYEEIAQALEVPLGTVKSRIHNALSKLAGLLRPVESPARGRDEPEEVRHA